MVSATIFWSMLFLCLISQGSIRKNTNYLRDLIITGHQRHLQWLVGWRAKILKHCYLRKSISADSPQTTEKWFGDVCPEAPALGKPHFASFPCNCCQLGFNKTFIFQSVFQIICNFSHWQNHNSAPKMSYGLWFSGFSLPLQKLEWKWELNS